MAFNYDQQVKLLQISQDELWGVFTLRHSQSLGWAPRMRQRFKYFNPDEYYEAVVSKLVTTESAWLDVGCGRYVFPSNVKLAEILARRCSLLVGVDPDSTIEENTVVHRRSQTTIEDFRSDDMFDLVTLRMVAEHMSDPEGVVNALASLIKPGGKVVVYTINRWSPVPMITWLTPFKLHYPAKRMLWNEKESKDTFPVAYRMNTRRVLASLFEKAGFREFHFSYLDDCRTFSRFRLTMVVELLLWRMLRTLGLHYPENCLLGIYERL